MKYLIIYFFLPICLVVPPVYKDTKKVAKFSCLKVALCIIVEILLFLCLYFENGVHKVFMGDN